jgi:preprotein translocase subunit SecF
MFDFAGKRWWYLGISLVLFVVAATILAIPPHLRPGIEFTSGSSFTIRFTEQQVPQEALRSAMSAMGYSEARIQGAGENRYIVRTRELEGAPALRGGEIGPVPGGEIDTIQAGLEERFGALVREEFATVSGTVSNEIVRNATLAVLAASVAILVYISLAFRRLPRPWRYGTAAIIALLHDTFIILGLFSLLGKWRGTEVDTAFITALLTVIGFSVHDTIVVFDRIREKLSADPYIPFEEAVNASLTETLARSLNTTFTVVITVTALLLIGGVTIRNFLLVLLIGVIAGTYSSIGVAAQTLVAWENNDIGRFLRRITGRGAPPTPEAEPA